MENKNSLSLSTVIALIKKYAQQYETTGIQKVEGVAPSSIKFTLTDGSHYTVSLNLTASGISFNPTGELTSSNVQSVIEEIFEKLNGEHHLISVDLTNTITNVNVDSSGVSIQSDALFETSTTESEVPVTLLIPIKGSEGVVVDKDEIGNTVTIHLDQTVNSKLGRTLLSPVSRPITQELVSVDQTGGQAMVEVGEGLKIEADALKQNVVRSGSGDPTSLTGCFIGQIYINIDNQSVYICVGVAGGQYTWKELMPM